MLARKFAELFNAGDWGECAGLLHDAGKFLPEFQEYLNLCSKGKGVRGSVPHSAHGAGLAFKHDKIFGRMLAYVISGHHGGLPDFVHMENRLEDVRDLDQTRPALEYAVFPDSFPLEAGGEDNPGFILSFFIRMLFSCLVDADWLDTEKFLRPDRAEARAGYPDIETLAGRFFPRLEELKARAGPSEVNKIRSEVLEACLKAAELAPGLFSLTVPTGGGKTLSSLAFALKHARAHGLERIVYVIPYMSIIEQNAKVFREFLGDESVVEHHSAFEPKTSKGNEDEEAEDPAVRRARLACENWDAPVVATTAVQFFESLFSARTSKCRKLHNLARSVIILDEAQMLPQTLLSPCLAAIHELAARYGSSLVLCTATQPAVLKREDFPQGLCGVREIAPDPPGLHQRLKRVRVEHIGPVSDSALIDRLVAHEQALCVVNTRDHARTLFKGLKRREGLFHLSALMTPAHRSRTIKRIKAALGENRPCLTVSTQLVEAGVDIDFPVVFRAAAGVDSIAQAAGRCDREGRLTARAGKPAGQVFVFTPEEKNLPRASFKKAAGIAEEMIGSGFTDLLAPEAVEHYFSHLFWHAGDQLDSKNILRDLKNGAKCCSFNFRTLSDDFRLIDDYMRPLIAPHDEVGAALVRELKKSLFPGPILRKLQRYTVQLPPRQWRDLFDCGGLEILPSGAAILRKMKFYDEELGVVVDRGNNVYISGFVI